MVSWFGRFRFVCCAASVTAARLSCRLLLYPVEPAGNASHPDGAIPLSRIMMVSLPYAVQE